MFCSFCGKEIDEGMKFCPHCGKANVTMQVNPKQNVEADVAGFSRAQPKERGQPQKQANEWSQANSAPTGATNWKELVKGLTSIRATANDVHSICSSRLSQVFCVLLTVSLLLQIVSHHGIVAIITILPGIVICAGCWITCSESRRRDGETLGLSLISGGITVYFAVFAVICSICVLIGVIFTLPGLFKAVVWEGLIVFAFIGAVFGLVIGLLNLFLSASARKALAGKPTQDKAKYVSCYIPGGVICLLVIGVIVVSSEVSIMGFCLLLAGVIAFFPAAYWYYFRRTTVTARKIIQGTSAEWKVSENSFAFLLILASAKFVMITTGGLGNFLYSYLWPQFFEDAPEMLSNLFVKFVLSGYVEGKSFSIAGIISLAVVICAIILIWRITRIGKSNTRSNTQEHP